MNTESPGVIEPGHLYAVDEAQRRLRLGETSWRQLVKSGVNVIRHGRQKYVLADDLLSVLSRRADAQPQGASQ